ncbi:MULTISPECIES: oxidoreductase [unclassified Mesorhizobium]|uniref:oxidoreductase n=1 Tax=unclassified Mesorhizobium TaxID=325217 RepID=UPI000FCADD2D|nr:MULTISPECIES: oxidoreductase [unclassified Mesorhizobium]RVC59556.1 oxidoreductase [Mesorhizobium sp. M4B.F.Ca.ET.088.02.2.1]RUW72268.1 oxidoreductase [Mesorhizobium sp. M4B.F.Ca.ET.049.02.1.2]RWF33012.1 MAG: oxidoreductase [Mesorhizobium sp.]TGV27718.1 oxidoreductase [Mesorhizobium sp. M4B.F.Ca.ET.143.01.1.1]TIX18943.1 MAG: SDR family NAD(P)-dependent oxidoreductase [Mesorhizobium sp.]
MFDRQKRTALVTGASSGMGKEIAKRLIQDGFQVYVAARQIDRMEDLAALGARPLRMDISKGAEIDAAVASILAEVDGVDVLVNNAGFGLYGPVEDIGIDEARYQFEVNVFGPARLTQLLLPAMRRKKAGTIVNITSMGGKIYTLLGAWYHATKHALEGWSDSLRLELAPFGIKVVVVEPGLIETGFGDVVADGLLKRSGTSAYAEVAQMVAKTTKASYGHGRGSDPTVIADVVSTAVRSTRPRTRYAAGKYARMMIGVRKWLGDRMFDRLILSQMR